MSLEALNASIAKWELNAKAERPANYKTSASDCPLCDLYMAAPDGSTCSECPIFKVTGERGCVDTPYEAASDAKFWWDKSVSGCAHPETIVGLRHTAREAARSEVYFLKEVRAKIYPDYRASTEESKK